jgi:hypothetical protein
MSWGVLTVGRVVLSEDHTISEQRNQNTGEVSLVLSAMQYGTNSDAIARKAEDVLALADETLPVTFTNKPSHNGFYLVKDVGSADTHWANEMRFVNWNLALVKVGPDNALDIESRMGTVVRANDFTLTGERWHAPPIGHYAYYTGSTLPSTMTRPTVDGVITVYRSIPPGINPRWGVATPSFGAGRVRVTVDGDERPGTGIRASVTAWELSNGLVRVVPLVSGGMLRIDAWNGSAWETKAWNIAKGGATTPVGTFDQMTVLRNDYNAVTIRLVKGGAPGRTLVDLTLRRGSRFLELYVQTDTSTTLGAYLETTETATNNTGTGYVVATNNDPDGNRFIVGSSRTMSYTTNRGISKASTTTFDAFIGAVFNGGTAVTGDQATHLRDQYIGALSESTVFVRR